MLAILTSQFELLGLSILAMVMFAYRRIVGIAPLYLMLGVYFVVVMLLEAPNYYQGKLTTGLISELGTGALWLPFLLLLLLIYETEGTKAAQQFFLGLLLLPIFLFCLVVVVFSNYTLEVTTVTEGLNELGQRIFLNKLGAGVLIWLYAHIGAAVILPIVYQALGNRSLPPFLCLFGSFCVFIVLNETIGIWQVYYSNYVVGTHWGSERDWALRLLSICSLSLLGHLYFRIISRGGWQRRQTFSFITDFFEYFQSTARMRMSLSEWADRYRLVVESSRELIFLLDERGILLNANARVRQFLGDIITENHFSICHCLQNKQGDRLDWQRLINDLEASEMTGRKGRVIGDFFLILPSGIRVEVELNFALAFLDAQRVVVLVARDVRVQREKERQRLEVATQMMHSQRLEAIGSLAGGIAHDFNNLLHIIQANADLLRSRGRLSREVSCWLDNVISASDRAAALTGQLLGFARKGKMSVEEIDVKQMCLNALQLFYPSASNLKVRSVFEPVPLLIYGDENQLSHVLLNLLINSRDAIADMPDGCVTIRAEVAKAAMPVWASHPPEVTAPENYICLQVRDNGCGMSDEIKQRIFDPYFTTKESGQGTGLGLAMVYGCIHNHKGWIQVDSTPGRGAIFSIFLPRVDKPSAASESPRPPFPPVLNPKEE